MNLSERLTSVAKVRRGTSSENHDSYSLCKHSLLLGLRGWDGLIMNGFKVIEAGLRRPPQTQEAKKIICNFDVSMYGFVQGINDKFDWTRHNGSTPSSGTGPSFDHTTGNLTGEL
ncbi:unnamed protein product [Porites evermanni]|uniref:MAM domain-containing protein n=1 Tax=Porites evermanni TaxID=104178 RepID=A0ABN8SCE4_9CNID|nr:unnamed protein product [Porites evermanni]